MIVLIALAVTAPVVLSYAAYYLAPRGASVNYGELLPTQPMPAIEGTRVDGTRFRLADQRGAWTIVLAAPGHCDAACQRALYATRQARTMQGREMDRVQRVWLVIDATPPASAALQDQPALIPVLADAAVTRALPRGEGAIYLVDPLGNQVLAWPADPDIKALANDLGRVLKASRIG
jgi:hypothetical protein